MEETKWHDDAVAEDNAQQSLGRMLVPVGQPDEEPPKKKRHRNKEGNERRRLIIHIVILVILLGLIIFGIYYFLHEEPRQAVPHPDYEQVDSIP